MNILRRLDPAMVRLVGFIVALAVLVALLFFAGRVFLPLLLGLALAYLLDPGVSWLERHGWSRALATSVIFALVVVALIVFVLVLAPILANQARELVVRLPEYEAAIEARVRPLMEQVRAEYPEQFEQVRLRAMATVREKWPQMLESAIGWLGTVFSSVLGFLLFLLDLIFVPVFAFYLLVDFPKIKSGALALIPIPYRALTIARLSEVDEAVASFLRGQLTIAIILAAINGAGLTLLGVPLGLLIGIVAGLANMIPYMSLVVGLAPAMLMVWIEHQSLARLLGVVLVFTGAQMLEGTVLSPRILSKKVKLHPVWVLLAIIIGGRAFGVVGMLVAVPFTAAVQVFVRHWLISYRRSKAYLGEPTGTAASTAAPPEA